MVSFRGPRAPGRLLAGRVLTRWTPPVAFSLLGCLAYWSAVGSAAGPLAILGGCGVVVLVFIVGDVLTHRALAQAAGRRTIAASAVQNAMRESAN